MPICPLDFQYCIDDLCHSGRCIASGEPVYEQCVKCGGLCDPEDGDGDLCEECDMEELEERDDDETNLATD